MPKIQYQRFNFKPATLTLIQTANSIIAEYPAQGFDLTVAPARCPHSIRLALQLRPAKIPVTPSPH